MNTLLFAVGICVFMITVYGTVMAGGATLKRKQEAELADDIQFIVKDDGTEIIAQAPSAPLNEPGPAAT